MKMAKFLAILIFHYNIDFIVFAIHILSIVLNFLNLTIRKKSVLWEPKYVFSRRNISSVWFRSVVLKAGGIVPKRCNWAKKLKGVIGGGNQHKGAKMLNH